MHENANNVKYVKGGMVYTERDRGCHVRDMI